jgi:hypothetical protein
MLDGEAEGGGPNRRNVWQDPYEGLPVPDVFPRYIYDSHVSFVFYIFYLNI